MYLNRFSWPLMPSAICDLSRVEKRAWRDAPERAGTKSGPKARERPSEVRYESAGWVTSIEVGLGWAVG